MTIKHKQSLIKKEIADNIKSAIGLSSQNIQDITNDLIIALTDILVDKKKINIKNFGSFQIIFKKEREGRNPKTKEKHIINERNSIKFKVSNQLKEKINNI
tara:strand:+ start:1781 stop:2083 length:303 start_codon:yes stop_codon:yes gene_type:complete